MKFFKKINRGVVFTLVVLSLVIVYVCVLGVNHYLMGEEASGFVSSFFRAEEDWRSIPENFRQDSNAYIKSIENDVKKYFANENVYEFYIKNVILSQYEKNTFYTEEECQYKSFATYVNKYDGELLEISVYTEMGVETYDIYMTLCEDDSELKIASLAQPYGADFSIQ
ncbi:MAG: hypothetical protein E7387_06460 [Ruminococcaceae bacterium]|nr:hypothetical protein [Oscillospiraceae bacterium]